MYNEKSIGIVGGMGPYASNKLLNLICDYTYTECEQDHLSIYYISSSKDIPDRTEYIMGLSSVNPAHAIVKIIQILNKMGADIISIPCNTTHMPPIYNVILESLNKIPNTVKLINLFYEVIKYIEVSISKSYKIGVLSTLGTYSIGAYEESLEKKGFQLYRHNNQFQVSVVHELIYHPIFGLKKRLYPISDDAKLLIKRIIDHYNDNGVKVVVLACTELNKEIFELFPSEITFIDSLEVLAQSIIRIANSNKLLTIKK